MSDKSASSLQRSREPIGGEGTTVFTNVRILDGSGAIPFMGEVTLRGNRIASIGRGHMQVSTIGLDLAKHVFQVHGIDAREKVVVRKQLRRSQVLAFFEALPPCLVGMEACATAHHWARELQKLGHEVRLMPARDVKAYVKRNKNDAADAEAICEAVRRPTMRFVTIKTVAQQGRRIQREASRDLATSPSKETVT